METRVTKGGQGGKGDPPTETQGSELTPYLLNS